MEADTINLSRWEARAQLQPVTVYIAFRAARRYRTWSLSMAVLAT